MPPTSPLPFWPWVRTVPKSLHLASALTLLWGSGAMAQDTAPDVHFDLNADQPAAITAESPPPFSPDLAGQPAATAQPDAIDRGESSDRHTPDPLTQDDPSSLPPPAEWLWSPLDRSAPATSAPKPPSASPLPPTDPTLAPRPSSAPPSPPLPSTARSTPTPLTPSPSTPSPSTPPPSTPPSSTPTPLTPPSSTAPSPPPDSLALSFALPRVQSPMAPVAPGLAEPTSIVRLAEDWWSRGSDSPLAIAIGAAEGTRTPQGDKTPAYYWHRDPGNGADNFGTFSYQHLKAPTVAPVQQKSSTSAKRTAAAEAKLPELADQLQLQRLKGFEAQLRQQAQAKGMTLDLVELINGLDLANQSEAAALSPWGYLDRLQQMRHRYPNNPSLQVLEARTWAYWSPERHTWDAPGLGNTYATIRRDQHRRLEAIAAALAHQSQHSAAIAQAIREFED